MAEAKIYAVTLDREAIKDGRWLVKAKGKIGARAFVAESLLVVAAPSPDEVYRMAQAGVRLEDATQPEAPAVPRQQKGQG